MSTSSKPNKSKFSFRSKTFWFSCLFLIYSIFGWFIVPNIVETQLKDNLKALANWDTHLSKVIFNPYSLSLTLGDADIQEQDSQTVISFDKLFINFSLIKTLSGTISFDEISLVKPFVNLDIGEDGITNFQRAFTSDTKEPETTTEEESTGIIDLFFNMISISSGKIHFNDDSHKENFQLNIEPLSLSLENFSTNNNQGGDYALSIALGNDQEIHWNGQIGIAPFSSKGHLELQNIASNSFWHYAKSASPYWLNQARISLTGDYQTSISHGKTELNVENSSLVIEDAVLSETDNSPSLLAFKNLSISPISFDLSTRSLNLGSIDLNSPALFIERSEDNTLNLLRPLEQQTASSSDNETPNPTESNETAFKWNISGVNVQNGKVTWRDVALSSPSELSLDELNISLGQMSDDLSQAFPYSLSFAHLARNNSDDSKPNQPETEVSTKQTIQGAVSPAPFTLKGKAELNQIELTLLQDYINETANITLENGQLNLQSDYDLALLETHDNSALTGKISSTLAINDLAITDKNLGKPLSGFKQFTLGPVDVSLSDSENHINIKSISLDQPYGDIFISEEGKVNLSQITKSSDTADIEETQLPENNKIPTKQDAIISILLELFEVKQGRFTYADASLTPTFTTQISDLNGSIENISTDSETKSKVSFKGNIDSQGKLDVKGTLNPLSDKPNTDINILANNIDLTMASPYSAKYAGYQIEKGKLDLDLSYLINDTKLTANNQILLNQFNFGKSVDSPDATSLPLPLAIGILKDRNGKIDIDLPISGDLSDPSFKISSVILNTFVNLITKVVTSPFSILGGLIEGADDISDIQFVANSNELSPEQTSKILSLAKALKERPNLTLEVRGIADANIDQFNQSVRAEPELIKLAKSRAQAISHIIIEEGKIDSARVFVLEPEIIALSAQDDSTTNSTENSIPTVSSTFTLGIR